MSVVCSKVRHNCRLSTHTHKENIAQTVNCHFIAIQLHIGSAMDSKLSGMHSTLNWQCFNRTEFTKMYKKIPETCHKVFECSLFVRFTRSTIKQINSNSVA